MQQQLEAKNRLLRQGSNGGGGVPMSPRAMPSPRRAEVDRSPASSIITSRRTSMDLGLGMLFSPRAAPGTVNQVRLFPLTSGLALALALG